MEEGEEVFAHGFLEFDEDDNAGFSLHSIEVKPYVKNDLVCLCAGVECLLLATKKYMIVRKRLNPDQPFEALAIPSKGDSEVRKMFMDVCGYHCIFVTSQKEAFYLHYQSDTIVPLMKLKDMDITSLAFNVNPDKESAGSILLGTRNGLIFSYGIENKRARGLVEDDPKKVLELPGNPPVFGLAFETYNCFVKSESRLGSTTLVMAATTDTCYQFTGRLPFEVLFQKYGSPFEINKHKKSVPKGNLQESELKLFYTINEKKKYELHSFAWKCEVGVCHGKFRPKEDYKGHVIVKDFIAEGYQKKDMPYAGRVETPEAIGITEYCIYFLYKDNLTAISKITKEIEYSETFRAGEIMMQMVYEVGTKSMWIYSSKGLYRLIVTGANKDLWKQQLDSSNFQEALKLCRENNNKHYGYVAGVYADSKFKNNRFMEAAKLYAASSKGFEEAVLKFLLAGENDGLEEYLTLKLDSILRVKDMKIQRVLLCAWLVELKLDKLNKISVRMDEDTTSDFVGTGSPKRQLKYDIITQHQLSEDFKRFLAKYDESLDTETIFHLLQNNGRLKECLEFAFQKNKYEAVVLHHINNRDISRALSLLKEMKEEKKKNALMLKYASIFMKHEPQTTIESLISYFPNIEAEGLLPALMSVDKKDRAHANKFLRRSMETSNNKLLHNLYLFFLAENPDPEAHSELLELIMQQEALQNQNQPLNIDKDFALNVCKYFQRVEAQIRVYGMLEFYEEAVKLALTTKNFELAKEYASLPNDDKIRKKLWLDIAKAVMKTEENMKTGLEIINESKGNLILNDVLPFVSPKVKLKAFRDDLYSQLTSYGLKIKGLKDQMTEFNKSADEIVKQAKSLQSVPVEFVSDKYCDHCEKVLIGEGKFYIFPCLHGYHRNCLIRKLFDHRNYACRTKVAKLEVIEIFRQKMQSLLGKRGFPLEAIRGVEVINYAAELLEKGKVNLNGELKEIALSADDYQTLEIYNKQLEGLLTDECLLCGNLFIETVDMPFDSPDEYVWAL